jgi:hypothetical protein
VASWDWAKLTGPTWEEHGQLVAAATWYFPSSFHWPPWNPAKKISSGYKSTEYYLYLFGLGPAIFHLVLPEKYYKNFCRLVQGVWIALQRRITGAHMQEAHRSLVQFVKEFEHLYYQKQIDWLHFTWPLLHTILHIAQEIPQMAFTPITLDQWVHVAQIWYKGLRVTVPTYSHLWWQ